MDNTFLGTNSPGHDSPCGGEVAAQGDLGPVAQEDWVGWWVMEPADAPSQGKDFWNTIGNYVAGIANKVTPADVAAFIKALASSTATASTPRRLRRFLAESPAGMTLTEGCASQRFVNVTAERYNCLLQKVAALGIKAEGVEGEASKDGITIKWAFDPPNHTLDVQCLTAPFFLSCGTINSKIHDFVDSCPGPNSEA